MGSPNSEGVAEEHPQHPVTVAAFCMQKTEVTVKEYAACAAAHACPAPPTTVELPHAPPAERTKHSAFCNAGKSDRTNHPMNCVDWNEAVAYCKWSKGRLPTEPEWELAARGTDGRTYPWGNAAPGPKLLNACGTECVAEMKTKIGGNWVPLYAASDNFVDTAPVGSFPGGASPYGVLDMAGNVAEWTASNHCHYPQTTCSDDGTRVHRGGSWQNSYTTRWVRSAVRGVSQRSTRLSYLGFRCAQ
jgi:formylglycine-generating enzyme required for sulfatase activity